jgi:hypothetical protein
MDDGEFVFGPELVANITVAILVHETFNDMRQVNIIRVQQPVQTSYTIELSTS